MNFNPKPYHFEFPIPMFHPKLPRPMRGVKCKCEPYATIEECVEACKKACAEWDVKYDNPEVKLFMTDSDGVHEVTEEGEFAD